MPWPCLTTLSFALIACKFVQRLSGLLQPLPVEGHEAVRLSERDGAHTDGFMHPRMLPLGTGLLRD
jgi:hypothetical protein